MENASTLVLPTEKHIKSDPDILINVEIISDNFSHRNSFNVESIDRIQKDQLTYNTFFWKYMKNNIPVIIR